MIISQPVKRIGMIQKKQLGHSEKVHNIPSGKLTEPWKITIFNG